MIRSRWSGIEKKNGRRRGGDPCQSCSNRVAGGASGRVEMVNELSHVLRKSRVAELPYTEYIAS